MVRGEEFEGISKLEATLVPFLAPSSSLALGNEGLFEVTQRPSLTQALALSSTETT